MIARRLRTPARLAFCWARAFLAREAWKAARFFLSASGTDGAIAVADLGVLNQLQLKMGNFLYQILSQIKKTAPNIHEILKSYSL